MLEDLQWYILISQIQVLTEANATRILFSESRVKGDLVASGVEFVHGGVSHVVNANKEVVLCAGYYHFPLNVDPAN